MDFKTTVVSAFITNINKNTRKIRDYIEHGIELLKSNIPKVIFIEKNIYDEYLAGNSYPHTHFIFTEKTDIYLYKYHYNTKKFKVHSETPEKDTIEYMFIQCNKTEWVKEAIELNFFNTEQFIWIDFGIKHMIKDDEMFKKYIEGLAEKQHENVRIGYCLDLTRVFPEGYMDDHIVWYFAGSIFGGKKDKLLLFASLVKAKCISIIKEKNTLMWEINIWYFIYKEHPELFEPYDCVHDLSIIKNY